MAQIETPQDNNGINVYLLYHVRGFKREKTGRSKKNIDNSFK